MALVTIVSPPLLSGCDETTDDGAVHERNADVDELSARPTPRRGKLLKAEVVARAVQWPDAAPHRTASIDRLDRSTLESSPVPVLLPPDFDEGANLSTGEGWYSLSATAGDVEITVQGSSRGKLIPGIRTARPTHSIRDNPGFVTRNEGIWSVSWTENGAAYSLEVSCARPFSHECDDEGFALSWVDTLVLGGGQGVRR